MNKLNLPNKLALGRIIGSPILMIFLMFRYSYSNGFISGIFYISSILLFIVLSFSDFLDGYLARKNNEITDLGKVLDPIADKIFVFSIFLILVKYSKISIGIVFILLLREFVISAIRILVAEKKGSIIAASSLGKLKTVFQMIALFFIILLPLDKKIFADLLMMPAVFFSIISIFDYAKLAKEYV